MMRPTSGGVYRWWGLMVIGLNLFFGQRVPDASEADRLEIFAIGCGKFFHTKVPKGEAQSQINDPAKRKVFLLGETPNLIHYGG